MLAMIALNLAVAANGLGGIAGAEISYHLLLPGFGVHVGIGMIGVGYSLTAVGLVLAARRGREIRCPSRKAGG